MNNLLKGPVGQFYIFVIAFILILPVDSQTIIQAISILFFAMVSLLYLAGRRLIKLKLAASYQATEQPLTDKVRFCLIASQASLSAYVITYYTGMSVGTAVLNVYSGESNYYEYQQYFSNSSLSQFSFSKIPAILSFFYVKLVFIFLAYKSVVEGKGKKDSITLVLTALPVLALSLSRGTNIEIFEIFIVIMCASYIRGQVDTTYRLPIFKITAIILLIVVAYTIQIAVRYNFEYTPNCFNEFCYQADSIVYKAFPVLFSLSGYFYFAPDYMARLLIHLFEDGFPAQIFLPLNGLIYDYESRWMCRDIINCGPTWAPDFERLLYSLGVIGAFIVVILLSAGHRLCELRARYSFVDFLGFYILSLQLISMPIGKLVYISSANILLLCLFIGLVSLRFLGRKVKG
jgi:hypothetical protein